MEQNLPEDVLKVGLSALLNTLFTDKIKKKPIWEKLKKTDNVILPSSFPLIPSNSPAAKSIRFALLLAVLFKEINRHIFQPTYSLAGGNHLREALGHLAKSNGEQEAFCRRIILSIDSGVEREALKAAIQAVVQSMSTYTGGLFSEAQHDAFCTKIKKIAQSAAEAWLPTQRSPQKFETIFEPFDPDNNEWNPFPFAGENRAPATQGLRGLYLLNIFPCICLLEDEHHYPLSNTIQLCSSQELYMTAQREATQIANSAITRRSSARPRRQSTAGSNGKPFLGGNSTKV